MANYKPIPAGVRELGRSSQVQAECLAVAGRIATDANSVDPRGRYRADRATVPSGWDMEDRAGAVVTQTAYSHRAGRNRVLVNASR